MKSILAEDPPPMDGSVAMETHTTHLLFAEAELTRLTGPNPVAWTQAVEAADFIYFRLYAQIRLGEALLQSGSVEEGRETLKTALAEAEQIGAQGLVRLSDTITSSQP